jgi:hypothetical protein
LLKALRGAHRILMRKIKKFASCLDFIDTVRLRQR